MNRKTFLQNCACGLSAGAASLVPVESLSAAETNTDWRIPFVQRRYAKLLDILSKRMDQNAVKEILNELGATCSIMSPESKYFGDLDGLIKSIKESKSGDTVTYDREKRILTMDSGERAACFCPFNGANTSGVVCNCSLGWQQHTWETFFQKKVTVELKESVLRGGKRCAFEIHVSEVPVDGAAAG
jgi:hypothetical protein